MAQLLKTTSVQVKI